ncbi:MAG: phosphopantothenoylcysteine decarboxylase [Planctomycetota bacterium]|nr:MAG: phosphopantothenoylcysteine decarboxylase [Planctomycetota bacterium]
MPIQDTLRILVTAGPTREYIDSVRYISNDSSGRMGIAIAAAAARRGHSVTLVHGPVSIRPPRGVRAIGVISAAEMLKACLREWPRQDALVMAAAVADYTPARRRATKLKKSSGELSLRLKPTPDVLRRLSRNRRADQVVIGFALEDTHARRNAAEKLARKNLDAIVLNRPHVIGSADTAMEILLAGEPGWITVPPCAKAAAATRLVRLVERLHSQG